MYTLHYWPDTASTIISLILTELDQPFTANLINRDAGELDSQTYRDMNPLGQIPAFRSDDGPLFETAAIVLYLCERHPGLAPAPGDPDRGQFLKWLFFISTNIHPAVLQMFYPERTAGPLNTQAVVEHAKEKMTTFLTILNDQAQIPADRASALGYYIAVLMRWMAADFPSSAFPNLHRTLSHLQTRPAALSCAIAEGMGATIFTNPD